MERVRILIVGAGVAGAATAYGLTRAGTRGVRILERERFPGAHASGRNAALIRRNLKTETDCRLSLEAAKWMQSPPADIARRLSWYPTGSLLLFREAERARAEADFALQARCGLPFSILTPQQAAAREPLLDARAFDGAQWTPGDGRIDVVEFLGGLLDAAVRRGAVLECGANVESLLVEGGRCTGVKTSRGEIHAEWVVNAAGGWANRVVGGSTRELDMTPCRRTMLVTEPAGADPSRPFTWDDGRGFYFREDHGGYLWSPCDEVPTEACDESVDPAWVARARSCARELTPSVAELRVRFAWGCLRTLTFDREPFVGPDPELEGLFWVAGLGGHGVTLAPRIAELAADLLLTGSSSVVDPKRVSPGRPGGRR